MVWWKLQDFRKLKRHETPERIETPERHEPPEHHETPERYETPERHETPPQVPLLPDEIFLLIAELSEERARARLIQTCHRLRKLVEPILYRHIGVRKAWEPDRLNGYRLHQTLAARRDLLPVIRSYHGPLIPEANNTEIIVSSEPSKGEALRRRISTITRKWLTNELDPFERANIIFSGAVNIRELHCTGTITEDGARVLRTFRVPQGWTATANVQSLVLRIGPDSPQLAPILRAQLKLRHLELQLESDVPLRLEKTDLPELESLKAELRYAAEIVPGRPVKKLELLNDWTSHKDSLQKLALSTCGITEFTAQVELRGHSDSYVDDSLVAPARYLHGIERLCFLLAGRAFGHAVSFSILLVVVAPPEILKF